jgi:hypothetical protein
VQGTARSPLENQNRIGTVPDNVLNSNYVLVIDVALNPSLPFESLNRSVARSETVERNSFGDKNLLITNPRHPIDGGRAPTTNQVKDCIVIQSTKDRFWCDRNWGHNVYFRNPSVAAPKPASFGHLKTGQ